MPIHSQAVIMTILVLELAYPIKYQKSDKKYSANSLQADLCISILVTVKNKMN